MKFPTYRKQVKSSRRSFYDKDQKGYYRNVYLKSDHWKTLRKEKFRETNICEKCGTHLSLDVHHEKYKGLYDVKLSDLKVLCRLCHTSIHQEQNHKKKRKTKKYRKNIRYSNNFFILSDSPYIQYFIILFIIKYLTRRRSDKYPKNVKKARGWENVNVNLHSGIYARSKIYNDYYKNMIR